MPPTSSDTDAIAASSRVSTREEASWDSSTSDRFRTLKSSSCEGCSRCRWRSRARISPSAAFIRLASRILMLTEPTARPFAWLPPITLVLAVLSGMRIWSSWSWPQVVWPLRSSTPMTVNGTFLMRITSPSGSSSPNRLRATVCPIMATLAAASTSSWVSCRPSITSQSRAGKYSGVIPSTAVAQFRFAYTTWTLPRT